MLLDATPLLEEERNTGGRALVANASRPRQLHRTGARATLPTNDDPVDRAEIEGTNVFEEGLDREKSRSRYRAAKAIDPRHTILSIFDGDA